jgi:replicative DNA helicase
MVTADDREILDERLLAWAGPLPFSVVEEPKSLARFAKQQGVAAVVIDSLKDIAVGLSKDEVGSSVNIAFQELLASGVELLVLHHQKKEQAGLGKPKKLSDVYGSRWLTAGMGSVILLWGEPGDLVVEFVHLKQPTEEIGPLQLIHDHGRGETRILESVDALDLVTRAGVEGVTAEQVAAVMFSSETPTRNEIEKARRKLERLHAASLVAKAGERPNPVRYVRKEAA